MWLGLNPWPRYVHMQQRSQKKKKEEEKGARKCRGRHESLPGKGYFSGKRGTLWKFAGNKLRKLPVGVGDGLPGLVTENLGDGCTPKAARRFVKEPRVGP